MPGSEDNFLTSRKAKLSLFLNIKNLETFNGTKDDLHKQGTSYREVVNKSSEREGSENGIVFTGFDDNRKENQTIYIVHNPNQIKSATDNIGTFSRTDNNIYHADTNLLTATEIYANPIADGATDNAYGVRLVNDMDSFVRSFPEQYRGDIEHLMARDEIKYSCM